MKRFQKLVAWALMLAMLCGSIAVSAQSDDSSLQRYEEAAETLTALGILEGDEEGLSLNRAVTRAEMVAIMIRVMGLEVQENEISMFQDVSSSHWALGYINLGVRMGLVNGYDSNTFAPDDPVTYEEAVKTIVCALGFESQAEYMGGYPSGYLSVASQNGVLKKTDGFTGQIIKRGALSQLIFNALDVDMAVITGAKEEGLLGEVIPGRTMLSEYLNLRKGKGVVEATALTDFSGMGSSARGQVQIDGELFSVGKTDVNKYLGYHVTYYASVVSGDFDELLYVRVNEKRNDSLVIPADRLLTDSGDFSVTKIPYENENGKIEYADLSPYADLVYNGVSAGSFTAEDLKIKEGQITLLDNDKDGVFELILAESYENIVLDYVSRTSGMAYDLYDASKKALVDISQAPKGSEITLERDGMSISVAGLTKYNILSVAESGNTTGRRNIKVMVSGDTVKGMVSEISEDEKLLVIDGKEYEVANNIRERLKKYVLPGFSGKFYLDVFGKVAAFEEDTEGDGQFVYGYLMNVDQGKGISEQLQLKILTVTDGIKIFQTADRLNVDGDTVTDIRAITARLSVNKRAEAGTQYDQLIRYKTNADGEVYKIDTLTQGLKEEEDSLTKDVDYARRRYLVEGTALGTVQVDFLAEQGLIVFVLPYADDIGDDKKYETSDFSYLKNGAYINCEAFDLSDGMSAKVMLAYDDNAAAVDNLANPVIVEKISVSIDENGETVPKLNMISRGERSTLYTTADKAELLLEKQADGSWKPKYKCGDVLRLDTKGNLLRLVEKVLSPEEEPLTRGFGYDKDTWYFSSIRAHYGYGVKKDGDYLVLQTRVNKQDVEEPFKLQNRTKYTLYSKKKDCLVIIEKSEVDDYLKERNPDAKILVLTQSGFPLEIVIMDLSD